MTQRLRHVLLVDDDDDLLEAVEWALTHHGFHVDAFSDAREALEFLETKAPCPDLIVVDFFMDKMAGGEFALRKKLIPKASVRRCPLVFVSGSPQEVLASVSRDLFDDVLGKPLDLDRFIARVRALIGAPPRISPAPG